MNVGDVVSQLIIFVILLGLIYAVYYVVRSILKQSGNSNSKNIEHKLDKIIDRKPELKKTSAPDGTHEK